MAIIALTSAKGSPGVTTGALALAWVWPEVAPGRSVLVVDADMAGGDIAAGYLRGAVSSSGGLLGLVGDRSGDRVAALWEHVIALDDDAVRLLLPGISGPAQGRAVAGLWPSLAEVLVRLGEQDPPVDVLLDLGRLGSVNEATVLRERAAIVLLTLRSSLTSVAAARSAVRQLRGEPPRLRCLLVGENHPYTAGEITDALQTPILASLAVDPSAATVFSAGSAPGLGFARSPLMRSVRAAAAAIRDAVSPEVQGDAAARTHLPVATAIEASGGRA